MALEIGEHLLSVHKEHCVGRNQLDIYGKVGFSAQHANKSLASEEPAFVKMYCGRSFFFAVLCLMFSALFCFFFFSLSCYCRTGQESDQDYSCGQRYCSSLESCSLHGFPI